jgi:hypothetical protein
VSTVLAIARSDGERARITTTSSWIFATAIEHLYDSRMVGNSTIEDGGDGETTLDERLAMAAAHLDLANSHLVDLVVELLETEAWQDGGERTPESFLVWKMGLSSGRAKQVVAVARKRSAFPVIGAMFGRGEVSFEQMQAAFKAPSWADANIADFVTIATVPKIERATRSSMFEGDPDEPTDETAQPTDRLRFGATATGRWTINGNLSLEDGRLIESALTERKDAQFAGGNDDVTWADALTDVARCSLDHIESGSRRDHYRTWLHLDVTDGSATTTDGWRIPMSAKERLLCDGVVQPVWERDGVPFSVGRSQRVVPERTRRVIEQRDRGCRVPGCSADRFVEIHHIVHWLDGGPTDTWNLLSLCPRHHQAHHRGEVGIAGNADEFDGVGFTDSAGVRIPGSGRPAPPGTPLPDPPTPYEAPLNGRFDWNWIGLGWVHPNALARRREQLRAHHSRRAAA